MALIGMHLFGMEIRRRHILAAALLAGAVALSTAFSILPDMGLRWGLIKALRGLGMVEVSVSDTDLSLFDGSLVVRKMVARPALGASLGVKDVTLRFRWAPLLSKRVVIDRVVLAGVEIHVTRRADGKGFIIDGLPMAVAESAPEAPDGSTPDGSTPWGFDVASLELTDSSLLLTDGAFTANIAVARMVMEDLDSRNPARPLSVRLQGSLNGAAVAMSGSALPFAAEPRFSLEARLDGLDLKTMDAAVAKVGLAGLAGRADLALSLTGTMGKPSMTLQGSSTLHLLDAAMSAPIHASAAKLDLDLRGVQWTGDRLDLAALAEASALSVKSPHGFGSATSLKFDLAKLGWDGHRLDLTAKLDAATLAGGNAEGSGSAAALMLDAATLSWDGTLDWQGRLSLGKARILAPGVEATPDAVNWNGRFTVDSNAVGSAEGRLDLGSLAFKGFDHAYGHKRAVAEGRLDFGQPGKLPVAAKVKFSGDGLSLRNTVIGLDWLALDHVEANELALGFDGAASAGRVAAAGLTALRQDGKTSYPWRVEAKSIRMDRPSLDADGDVDVADIQLDGLTLRITRGKDGLLGMPPSLPQANHPSPAKSDPPDITLGRLTVSGDSRVVFRDLTLGETVRLEARPVEISLSDLDSEHPDRDSPFSLRATVGEATGEFSGVARPFADSRGGRLDGRIKALDLPPLSPYLAEALGVNLQTGQFSGSFTGTSSKGALDGRLEVELANLFIAPPDPNAPVAKKMEMPVDTVLDLLRDGDDRIRLTLPVRGDLTKPDLDISDAVAQAVAGALKSTLLTTLKLAFPVAALIEMAVDAQDQQGRLTLAPLAFAPGSTALSPDHRKTLEDVGQLLKGRPSLKLTLCGKADSADWPVLAERRRAEDKPLISRLERLVGVERKPGDMDRDLMARLAEFRAQAAKQFLVEVAGIDAARVFSCRPEIEAATGKGPRVELLL
ncbi:hypothetical protein CU669_01815 [Paramagnetospirillum kuznetsovii]|uniref:DUF748 domain-containing protein n=1 Tax=Paramagnetospirillum kuznetsovii TaxID=2053833 RepID=A0A364P401_9PROT|nr:DUF748 domain-containing protein [Paramagnetospirillum kuznetsovii]RAU23845.1 hypothetical protein CU669_01815 [Paramagnetospirillum kuznetsovii]